MGNVEGRDLLHAAADVVVTDGFTGNVALKTLEGSLRFFMDTLLEVFGADDEAKAAAEVMLPRLAPLAAEFDPDGTGGAMLLGVDGVCVISHGSSSATGHRLGRQGGPRRGRGRPRRPPGPGRGPGLSRPVAPGLSRAARPGVVEIPPLNRDFIGPVDRHQVG